jgi:3-oxoacyl-(acyl-carrier-protein) synthase
MSTSAQDAVEQLIGVFNTHGFRRILPHYLNQVSPHTGAVEMGLLTGFQDQVMTFATACTCGVNAFRYAFEELRNGRCEAFLVSAMDASITPSGVASFCRAHMVTTAWNHDPKHASRPFDLKRDGGVLGEGAVTVLLETEEHARRRGARVCAEVLGCATAGRGCGGQENERVPQAMAQTMTAALADAGVGSEAVGYIGANGVSDPGLDAWETVAVKAVFGEQARRIPISSIKSMIGIAPGPAGVLQTVSTALAIRYEMLPPTINYEYADPVCDLDYVPNRARRNRVQTALVLTHGLGGGDVAIVLGRHRDSAIGGP